jgi:hypothetical protein
MPLALLQGLGAPEQTAIIIVVLLAVCGSVWGIGFAWGRSKRDKKRYCPKCNRELKQPKDARCCAYCGAQLF